MVILVSIVVGALLALFYSRGGLFVAAVALVSVFLAALTALAVGPTVVHLVGYESPHALAITLAAVALFAFMIIRGTLVFVNADVDFHPLVERLGGGLAGFSTGLVTVGFASVCLLCWPGDTPLERARDSTSQAARLILTPAREIAQLLHINGSNSLGVDQLLLAAGPRFSPFRPPAVPDEPETDDQAPDAELGESSDPWSGRR